MAVNVDLPELGEARLNAPDLDENGELNVERYQLPSGDEIENPYLAEVWDAARAILEEGYFSEEQPPVPAIPQSPFRNGGRE